MSQNRPYACLLAVIMLTAVTAFSATLDVTNPARYEGSYGAVVTLDSTSPAYVVDETPAAESRYRVRFYVRVEDATVPNGTTMDIFRAVDGSDNALVKVVIEGTTSGPVLRAVAREGGGGTRSTVGPDTVERGWWSVELDWMAASSGVASDGHLKLWLNGAEVTAINSLATGAVVVETAQWGTVEIVGAGTAGAMWLDAFESVRDGYIGLLTLFSDVPDGDIFQPYILTMFNAGITAGCGTGVFCPDSPNTRGQMAVFLLKAAEGGSYAPPACTVPTFNDVPCSHGFAAWIEELADRGITAGCGGGNYCPDAAVTRGQMAVFLLKAFEGQGYTPPACTTPTFNDVPCSDPFAPWIEELAGRDITAGCGGGNYCPDSPVSRSQMAVFLTKTWTLPVPTLP